MVETTPSSTSRSQVPVRLEWTPVLRQPVNPRKSLKGENWKSENRNPTGGEPDVRHRRGQPGGLLPVSGTPAALPGGSETARRHAPGGLGMALLRQPAHGEGVARSRLEARPQTAPAADAGR